MLETLSYTGGSSVFQPLKIHMWPWHVYQFGKINHRITSTAGLEGTQKVRGLQSVYTLTDPRYTSQNQIFQLKHIEKEKKSQKHVISAASIGEECKRALTFSKTLTFELKRSLRVNAICNCCREAFKKLLQYPIMLSSVFEDVCYH